MEIDTGSDVSIINEQTFKFLKQHILIIKPLGVIDNVNVTYEVFHVINSYHRFKSHLLGKNWMSVLMLNWNSFFDINKVETSFEKFRGC